MTCEEEEEIKKPKKNKTLSFSLLKTHFSTEICNLLGNFQENKRNQQKKNTYISVSFVDSLSHSIMVSLITLTHTYNTGINNHFRSKEEKYPQMTYSLNSKKKNHKSERE